MIKLTKGSTEISTKLRPSLTIELMVLCSPHTVTSETKKRHIGEIPLFPTNSYSRGPVFQSLSCIYSLCHQENQIGPCEDECLGDIVNIDRAHSWRI